MEFGIALPTLMILTFAIIQYGTMMFAYNSMYNGARTAARELATSVSNETQAAATARAQLVGWLQTSNCPTTSCVITARDTSTTGTNYVQVTVTAPGNKAGLINFTPAPTTLTATVNFRKE
jgi:Flp pilus assembly protein TadG